MTWNIALLIALICGWFLFQAWSDSRLFKAAPGCTCENLTAAQAAAFLRAHPGTQVLDVRSAMEFAGGALPGAVNISIGDADFAGKVGRFDKAAPVLVYCAGGFRSRKALVKLKAMGFANIQHLHRGYMSWPSATPQ